MAGIQNQYAPNAYIRLWSCLEGFERDDLTRALERRTVVQATLMRATIHIVAKRDFWPYAAAIRAGQRDWWLRRKPKPDERELEAAADELRALMASGPRRHEELAEVLGRGWGMVGPWLELVRVPFGNLGAAARPSLPDRREMGRVARRRLRRRPRPPRAPVRGGVRTGFAHRHRGVGRAERP
jgi:hypothetical protein